MAVRLYQFCPVPATRAQHGEQAKKERAHCWSLTGRWRAGVCRRPTWRSLWGTASPDLNAYYSVLRQYVPQLDVRDIQRLADYGNLLRIVDKVFWATVSMQGSSYEFLVNPLSHLRSYEPQLAATLRAVNWRWHD